MEDSDYETVWEIACEDREICFPCPREKCQYSTRICTNELVAQSVIEYHIRTVHGTKNSKVKDMRIGSVINCKEEGGLGNSIVNMETSRQHLVDVEVIETAEGEENQVEKNWKSYRSINHEGDILGAQEPR